MRQEAFWLPASDGTQLYVNRWFADTAPKAVVMIAHGMAEHSARYARVAEALVADGFEVYGHDQRGHGRTAEHGTLGHYADADGWAKVVDDLSSLNHLIRQQHPQAPILLLAHSMGSYIGMAYLMQHSCSLQGVILSGSNYQSIGLYNIARQLVRFERWRLGPKAPSTLIDFLSFGSFNKAFKPNRTDFDWLSRDPAEVDKYVADPLCGFSCSTQLWWDLMGGFQQITPLDNLAQIDSELPLLVTGGDCDPVSQGKRLADLADALRTAGMRHVDLKIYPHARHELLNESNRDEVTRDLRDWLNAALSRSRSCPTPAEETP